MAKRASARSVETPARATAVDVCDSEIGTSAKKSAKKSTVGKPVKKRVAGKVAAKTARLPRAAIAPKTKRPPRTKSTVLVERVARAVERELTQIERIVGGPDFDPDHRTEAERRARTLASLARTLAELRRLRAADDSQRPADDTGRPRDLDEFRRTLWQRLEGLVGRTAPAAAHDDEAR